MCTCHPPFFTVQDQSTVSLCVHVILHSSLYRTTVQCHYVYMSSSILHCTGPKYSVIMCTCHPPFLTVQDHSTVSLCVHVILHSSLYRTKVQCHYVYMSSSILHCTGPKYSVIMCTCHPPFLTVQDHSTVSLYVHVSSSFPHCTEPQYSIIMCTCHPPFLTVQDQSTVSLYMYMCHPPFFTVQDHIHCHYMCTCVIFPPVQDCCTRNRTTSRRTDISRGHNRHHRWIRPPPGSGHLGCVVLVCSEGHLEAAEEETATKTRISAAVDHNDYFDRMF